MAYLKPPAFTRKVFNPLAMKLGVSGTWKLTTTGRRSGAEHSVPVIPFQHDGQRYLVSPRGECDWVQNLRAAGRGTLERKDENEQFTASEVPVGERPPILETYRSVAGRSVAAYFKKLPAAADHPTFRISKV